MKRLFSEHLASPFDISSKGRTPLHFAATAVKSDMIEFLVNEKAETDVEDQDHLSPNDIIWELYLRKPEKRQHLLSAAGLSTSDSSSLEKQGFTGVHRVVLGLAGAIDLEEYLRANDSEINHQDLTGKTALAWAASRIHTRPVKILLDHQASVHICDYRNKTPLHYAAGSGAPESISMILEAIDRAESEKPPNNGKLIEAGDDKHRTPLNYATRMNLLAHTVLLLNHNADVEAVESGSKRSILLNAIYWNSHLVLPVLLDHGARTDVQDVNGETILHHIARFSGLETLSIMAERDLGSVDTTVTNVMGLTAVDVFNSPDARCSPDGEERREIAVRLFSRILCNVTQGMDRSVLLVDQQPLGALETTEYPDTFTVEHGVSEEDTDEEEALVKRMMFSLTRRQFCNRQVY